MSIPGLDNYVNARIGSKYIWNQVILTTTADRYPVVTDTTTATTADWYPVVTDTTTADPNLIPNIWQDTTTYPTFYPTPTSPNGMFGRPFEVNDIYNLSNNYEKQKLTDVKNLFKINPNYLMKYITNIYVDFILSSKEKDVYLIIDIENVSLSNRDIFRTDEFHETISKEDFDKKIDKLANILDKSSNIKSQEIYFKEFFFYLVNEDLSFLNSTKGTSLANISINNENTNKFIIKLKLNETDFKTPNRFSISNLFDTKIKDKNPEDKIFIEI